MNVSAGIGMGKRPPQAQSAPCHLASSIPEAEWACLPAPRLFIPHSLSGYVHNVRTHLLPAWLPAYIPFFFFDVSHLTPTRVFVPFNDPGSGRWKIDCINARSNNDNNNWKLAHWACPFNQGGLFKLHENEETLSSESVANESPFDFKHHFGTSRQI